MEPTGTTEVWVLDTGPARGTGLAGLAQRLPPGERATAARHRHEGVRRRYVAGRALLRTLLGARLAQAPAAISLTAQPHGKPRLSGAGRGVGFNLSHSGDLVAVAVSDGAAVGVDVERIAQRDVARLAGRWFTPSEAAAVRAQRGMAALVLFHRIWTAKEAWLKARGVGLRRRPGSFEVRIQGANVALRDPQHAPSACIRLLDLGARYAGALALDTASAPAPAVRHLSLTGDGAAFDLARARG